eukprot:TRINITY_DN777_c0_g2_i2.p1 TRINITY_DN777_c0_g2~~TRINITY_DN777_c0_g2_i2.p1  ORF type:complete len:867 (+),score=166.62 TRINITY_DN777_c0_g2_i2:192-2792(+)
MSALPTSCIVYNRGEEPVVEAILGEGWGWFVVIGFGLFFTAFSMFLTRMEQNVLGTSMSSEQFNTAGRNVGAGLTAAVIVSQWTWAATLLMSSNMGWRVGISGPFWYASGATVQILLFAVLAIQVKRRASHMHTFLELVKARFGTVTHIIMIAFALMANMIVTAMLLLGGAATIADLTGMSKIWAAFLIPLLSCWIYTMNGGLKATFFASYIHAAVIFLMLIIFTMVVYASPGDSSGLYGSPSKVFKGLEQASLHAYFEATKTESEITATRDPVQPDSFSDIGAYIENDGMCYTADKQITETPCSFKKRGPDARCCEKKTMRGLGANSYCRADTGDCISISKTEHYESSDCGEGERCVPSLATMGSPSGLLFGITNIVGNFGTVFVDQSYWQSAVAAKPRYAVAGFLIGGMVWFAVPFAMATTNGLAGRALTTHPTLGALYITAAESGSGLTPARVLAHIMGSGGAFLLLLQLFMAITSTGSAEIIAVSSILTYDVYYEYINPELKDRRLNLKSIFYSAVKAYDVGGTVAAGAVQNVVSELVAAGFFEAAGELPSQDTMMQLTQDVKAFTVDNVIATKHLYEAVNRAVSFSAIEGRVLLRVSRFFTGVFAGFMGFLAVYLQTLGFSLGWVYMSMGVLIGSAVGPASLTILLERARGRWIGAGAIGGLVLGILGWCIKANVDSGEISYDSLGKDWPWVVGNLCAIFGGLLIALVGSMIDPDTSFKWEMLNERIALVDDIEPPKDKEETDDKLQFQLKIAVIVSLTLTFILIILWPLPMHWGAGVFGVTGFTVWVFLEIIWTIVGGFVIIGVPIYEMYLLLDEATTYRVATKKAEFVLSLAQKVGGPVGAKQTNGALGNSKVMLQNRK